MEHETENNNYRYASGSMLHVSGHIPVLLKETITVLDPKPGEFFIDGTVGNGGHSVAILEKIEPKGTLLGTDLDETTLQKVKEKITVNSKSILVQSNYADLPEILKREDLPKADGLLLDLGFSSEQLTTGRGFSFSGPEEPLLMTYDPYAVPVKNLLKRLNEPELAEIIKNLGEEHCAKRIAHAIKQNRFPIETNKQLAEAVAGVLPKNYERGRIHPATRTFLALRVYANQELANLEKLLNSLNEILKIGGRVAIISFNSLEDRIVKNYFREKAKEGKMEILTKKPITPSLEEIKQNSRSRSAKLRAAKLL
ncbi:MAG: 16S rRNA (cytosine(1402)-N(4))-methyltransferase RsmH [bacterium]|nr:16S rRNA (cytosine(1402)-N(4))-methyltransferase RsmH [bacterium]